MSRKRVLKGGLPKMNYPDADFRRHFKSRLVAVLFFAEL